jgi:hypothetical protein
MHEAKQFSQPYIHLQTGWIPKPIEAASSIAIDDRIIAKLEAGSKYSRKNRYGADRQTISFIEISIEAGILLGGKPEACFVLGLAGIEPMPS